jgi:hypothetical protein
MGAIRSLIFRHRFVDASEISIVDGGFGVVRSCCAMSWDLFVQDIPAAAARVDDIPEDFEPAPIGARASILAVIRDVAPFADFSDPAWVKIATPDVDVEVNLGDNEILTSFAFHVRGGNESIGLIADILGRLGLRAFDPGSDSGIFDASAAFASLEKWRAYRDRTLGRQGF